MPFAEVSRGIPGFLQRLRERFFLKSECVAMTEHSGSIIAPPREQRGAGGRADGIARIEAVKPQPIGRHGVKVRRLEQRMLVVACLPPTHVIRHDENNVGLRGICCLGKT